MPAPTAPPSGLRDFLPAEVALRQRAAAAISAAYRAFGFQPVATSALEDLASLSGAEGGDNEKLIFKVLKRGEALARAREAGEDLADLGLRFDLTLPLARYHARHGHELPRPFKAFHIGPVWRAERAQKGRYREFVQCDADILGAEGWGAEADVIGAILTAFGALGLSGTAVLLNDRRVVDRALAEAGVAEDKRVPACVIIDKLDKLERARVLEELSAEVGGEAAGRLEASLLGGPDAPAYARAGGMELEDLKALAGALSALFPGTPVSVAPSLMRGLGYYTGPVFEFRHPDSAGSLGGGGRYDRLSEKFGAPPLPSCGGSIGFERLMLILEKSPGGRDPDAPDAVVTVFSPELRRASLEAAAFLRKAGLRADLYPGAGKLKAQFKYADQKAAAFALVIGPDEAARGAVQLKDLATGEERALPLPEACAAVLARRPSLTGRT